MDKWEEGRVGERTIRDYLEKKHYHYFQVDMMVFIKGHWHVVEVKYQEQFNKPPFDGHGLPKWQIEARLEFQKETGIRAVLFIVDKITGVIYWQFMDVLVAGQSFQTNGEKPRIIFPISSYNILNEGNNG
jgi:hypothetical protein